MSLEDPSVLIALHTSAQFLGYDDAEMLERRERSAEALEHGVSGRIAECVD